MMYFDPRKVVMAGLRFNIIVYPFMTLTS